MANLKTYLTADTSRFSPKMKKAGKAVGTLGQRVKSFGKIAKRSFLVAGAAIAGAGGLLYGVYKLIRATAEAGDEVEKMSYRTGMSAASLSEFGFVAQIVGTDVMTFQKAIKSLARFVSYGRDDIKTYTRELDKLKRKVSDFDNMSPEEVFDELVGAIREYPDILGRSAIAQVAFGRAGQELMPYILSTTDSIKELRQEARDLGVVFDKEASEKSARFIDAMVRLKSAFEGIRNDAVLTFIDQVSGGIENIVSNIKGFRKEGKIFDWIETGALGANSFVTSMEVVIAKTEFWIDLFKSDFVQAAKVAGRELRLQITNAISDAFLALPLRWRARRNRIEDIISDMTKDIEKGDFTDWEELSAIAGRHGVSEKNLFVTKNLQAQMEVIAFGSERIDRMRNEAAQKRWEQEEGFAEKREALEFKIAMIGIDGILRAEAIRIAVAKGRERTAESTWKSWEEQMIEFSRGVWGAATGVGNTPPPVTSTQKASRDLTDQFLRVGATIGGKSVNRDQVSYLQKQLTELKRIGDYLREAAGKEPRGVFV